MDAKEFRERFLEGLNSLTSEDVKCLRDKFNSEGDYDVDEYGRSYWIPPESNVDLEFKVNYENAEVDLISDSFQTERSFSINNDSVKIKSTVNKEQELDLNVSPAAA